MIFARHGHAGACLAVVAMALSSPAQASTCLDAKAVDAARVVELGAMLLVSNLRCKAKGFDFHQSYEHAAEVHEAEFVSAHDTLKARFETGDATTDHTAYDRQLTAVANYYGRGKTDADTCHALELVNVELGNAPAGSDLLPMIATEMVRDPIIDVTGCRTGH
jgi:hypothetical protein